MKQNGTGICPNCGNQTAPGARFCSKCGTSIDLTEKDQEKTVELAEEQQIPNAFLGQGRQTVDDDLEKDRQTQIRMALILGGIIALLIIAVTMAIILISLSHDRAEKVWGYDAEVREDLYGM